MYCNDFDATKHKENCWAHFIGAGGVAIRYCKNFDESKYYLSWVIEYDATDATTQAATSSVNS